MADAKTAPQEEKKNCGGCNKPMKKLVKYYRNGTYYCNKNCYKKGVAAASTAK